MFSSHRLSATDQDDGPNGKITYSIMEDASGLLDIRIDTGEIIFARCMGILICKNCVPDNIM